jgi:predicted PilT family ATPase
LQTQASQNVAIPKEHHRFILGKGGSKLQELEAKTATKISMPKAGDANDKITISGPKEGIEKAIHEIRIISDEQVSSAFQLKSEEVECDLYDENFIPRDPVSKPCEIVI